MDTKDTSALSPEECAVLAHLGSTKICSANFNRGFTDPRNDFDNWITDSHLGAYKKDDLIAAFWSLAEKGWLTKTDSNSKSSVWFALSGADEPLNEYRFTTDCFITVSIDAPNEEAAWERVQAALSDRNWDDLRMFGADECEAHGVSECAQINIGHNPIFEMVWSSDDEEAGQ